MNKSNQYARDYKNKSKNFLSKFLDFFPEEYLLVFLIHRDSISIDYFFNTEQCKIAEINLYYIMLFLSGIKIINSIQESLYIRTIFSVSGLL